MQSESEGDQYQLSTSIDDLPDEVLELIFNKVDYQSALVCGLVCRRWLEVPNENIQLTISPENNNSPEHLKLMRTYKLILISGVIFRCLEKVHQYQTLLKCCERLELNFCLFENHYLLACMLAGCKQLKFLKVLKLYMLSDGMEEMEAVDSSANNFSIDLELTFYEVATWKVLQLFKIIKLDVSRLRINVSEYLDVCVIASMMKYIHNNHRLAFKEFSLFLNDSTLPPSFINQIKQLTHLAINLCRENSKIFEQIYNNVKDLEEFQIFITAHALEVMPLNELKSMTKLKFLNICLLCYDSDEPLMLFMNELQQLQRLKVNCMSLRNKCVLQFPGLTPQHQLSSMENLTLIRLPITRTMLQLIFKTMPNLVTLNISTETNSQDQRLVRNKNSISRLKHLETLAIDNFWVDENFLRNMKLPQLKRFTLISTEVLSFAQLPKIGFRYLAKQCPKLLEIKNNERVIASRKNELGLFINLNENTICEPTHLMDVFLNDENENEDSSSDYNDNDIEVEEEVRESSDDSESEYLSE